MVEKNFPYTFRMPKATMDITQSVILGVLDASGSMASYWPFLAEYWNKIIQTRNCMTITFSHRAKVLPPGVKLIENIKAHGGYTTNISQALQMVNELLLNHTKFNDITIIFISDGADSEKESLENRLRLVVKEFEKIPHKKINFLTIGVGNEFPTFLAMKVRHIYHNGQTNIPPVFLIDPPEKKSNWEEIFEMIDPLFEHQNVFKVYPQGMTLPWGDKQDKAFGDSYFFSNSDTLMVNDDLKLEPILEFNPDQVLELSKIFLSQLQLTSLKSEVKTQAKIAFDFLKHISINFYQDKDPLQKGVKISFKERISKKISNSSKDKLQIFMKEIKQFISDNILDQLDEQQAAKRLAIGTQVGKYHSKAMQLRGLTVEDFDTYKQEFIKILDSTKFTDKSGQEPSVISLENQKDIFMQPDLKQGLDLCDSQYQLVETMNLIGHAIMIKRTDGCQINPFLIQVTGIAIHHRIVDSLTLQASNNLLKLASGDGETEEINCVVPLFDKQDSDIVPFLKSKLYRTLVNFCVTQNVDTLDEQCHLSLLSNTALYLISQDNFRQPYLLQLFFSWRNEMLNLVYDTVKLLYYSNKNFSNLADMLISNPRKACITEHPSLTNKCEDPSKLILMLFMKSREQQINNMEEILEAIFSDIVGRLLRPEYGIELYFDIENQNTIKNASLALYKATIIENCSNIKEAIDAQGLKLLFAQEIYKVIINQDFKLEKISLKDIYFLKKGCKFSLEVLNKISSFFIPDSKIQESQMIKFIYHGNKYTNSYTRNFEKKMENDMEIIKKSKIIIYFGL